MENNITGQIRFRVKGVEYTLSFERYFLSDQLEKVKVLGRTKEIHFSSDRPFLKANNKRKLPNWKIISSISPGIYQEPLFVADLIYALETALEDIDFPRQPYIHAKNAT